VSLVRLRWRCCNCGLRLTEFVVGGSHIRPGSGLLMTSTVRRLLR
jgi:hypothetical protein